MSADVSTLYRIMNGYTDDGEGKRRDLVTRDLLGGGANSRSAKELDLDLHIPSGWERRLDLTSGETYLKKNDLDPIIHDLNCPPPRKPESTSSVHLNFLLSSAAAAPSDYQCTLEKVKSALERAGRESRSKNQQRRRPDVSMSPSSSTSSSSAAKRRIDQDGEEVTDGSDSSVSDNLMVAGCCKCLMYVLISRGNPRCPRCDSHVPPPLEVAAKKPRIDLNNAFSM